MVPDIAIGGSRPPSDSCGVRKYELAANGAFRTADEFTHPTRIARTLKIRVMDIGKPTRTHTVEPLEDPVPRELPEESPEREEPAEPPREPEQVPA
jgi:hypothetical protein